MTNPKASFGDPFSSDSGSKCKNALPNRVPAAKATNDKSILDKKSSERPIMNIPTRETKLTRVTAIKMISNSDISLFLAGRL